MPNVERIVRATHKPLALAVTLTLGATVLSYLGGVAWRFDYLAHGRVQWCVLSAVLFAAALATLLKAPIAKRYVALAALAVGLNFYPIAEFLLVSPPALANGADAPALRVMSVNVNVGNRHYDKTVHEILDENPDLLLMMEVKRSWMRHLATLDKVYPYKIAAPKRHAFGMVLYSKRPYTAWRIEEWGPYRIPDIVATLRDDASHTLRVLGVHTVPPVSETAASNNRRHSKHIFDSVLDREGPILLLGDWNDTPWSHSYRSLLGGTGFQNAAQGKLPAPTWRTGLLGGIMIDRASASEKDGRRRLGCSGAQKECENA